MYYTGRRVYYTERRVYYTERRVYYTGCRVLSYLHESSGFTIQWVNRLPILQEYRHLSWLTIHKVQYIGYRAQRLLCLSAHLCLQVVADVD